MSLVRCVIHYRALPFAHFHWFLGVVWLAAACLTAPSTSDPIQSGCRNLQAAFAQSKPVLIDKRLTLPVSTACCEGKALLVSVLHLCSSRAHSALAKWTCMRDLPSGVVCEFLGVAAASEH